MRRSMLEIVEDANTAMCPYGGSVKEEDKDQQIALAQAAIITEAIYEGLSGIASVLAEMLNKKE